MTATPACLDEGEFHFLRRDHGGDPAATESPTSLPEAFDRTVRDRTGRLGRDRSQAADLPLDERSVLTFASLQLVVRAFLDDASISKHDNSVGIHDG